MDDMTAVTPSNYAVCVKVDQRVKDNEKGVKNSRSDLISKNRRLVFRNKFLIQVELEISSLFLSPRA